MSKIVCSILALLVTGCTTSVPTKNEQIVQVTITKHRPYSAAPYTRKVYVMQPYIIENRGKK